MRVPPWSPRPSGSVRFLGLLSVGWAKPTHATSQSAFCAVPLPLALRTVTCCAAPREPLSHCTKAPSPPVPEGFPVKGCTAPQPDLPFVVLWKASESHTKPSPNHVIKVPRRSLACGCWTDLIWTTKAWPGCHFSHSFWPEMRPRPRLIWPFFSLFYRPPGRQSSVKKSGKRGPKRPKIPVSARSGRGRRRQNFEPFVAQRSLHYSSP